MKALHLFIILSVFLSSCGDGRRTDFTEVNENGKKVMTKNSKKIMAELISDFEDCREENQNLHYCRHFISKALCEFYEIDDFKENGEYVAYEKMFDIVTGKFGTWTYLGDAKNQKAMKTAQEHANNGQATVAISTNGKYGHVAIILPGELTKAGKWGGLKVPNCASFFMVRGLKPFYDKSVAYAWRTGDGIKFFSKKVD